MYMERERKEGIQETKGEVNGYSEEHMDERGVSIPKVYRAVQK